MSVIPSQELLKLLKRDELVISPILSDAQIKSSISIDLRLGNVALIVRARGLSHINPSEYRLAESKYYSHHQERGLRQKFERHDISFNEPLMLHPHSLILVPTLEWVKLPNNIKGIVTARSSWAREGLNIATANFINPGYSGIITLELSNLGQIPIAVYPGMRIAQIAFHYTMHDKVGNVNKSQFDLAFEPTAGNITKEDEAFIPPISNPLKKSDESDHSQEAK